MELSTEEYDKIMALLCSVDASNRELGLTLAKSLEVDIDLKDWLCFLPQKIRENHATLSHKEKNRQLQLLFVYVSSIHYFELHDTDTIPKGLFHLKHLTTLRIRNCTITEIGEEIAQLCNLEVLSISNMPNLRSISPKINDLSQLKELRIDNCIQLKLDNEWGAFPRLEKLSINHCNLGTLPWAFAKSKALKELDLSHNFFQELPPVLKNLSSLTLLKLNNCDFNPNELLPLPPSLDALYLQECKLPRFPKIDFRTSPKLRTIDLSDNLIKKLPETLFHQTSSVVQLLVNNNQIEKLPESLGNWNQLLYLNLEGNRLHQLPKSMEQLKQLSNLRLYSNRFNPKEIHYWRRLLPDCHIQSDYC